jgi:hypothetical protein
VRLEGCGSWRRRATFERGTLVKTVRNRTLIEREDDTRSWDNFFWFISHTMP